MPEEAGPTGGEQTKQAKLIQLTAGVVLVLPALQRLLGHDRLTTTEI